MPDVTIPRPTSDVVVKTPDILPHRGAVRSLAPMTPRVTVFISPDHDLYHTSLLLSGLCTLAARGAVDLRYETPSGDGRWLVGDPIVVCFDLDSGAPRRVAVDLRDGEGVSSPIIGRVDRYMKRAFFRPELERLPPTVATRMAPFGLNFGCRNTSSTIRLLRSVGWQLVRRGRPGLARLRQYLWTPGPTAFEQGPDVPVEAKIAFQTRLWTPAEVPPEEVEPLNSGRVAMVRALKAAFGDRFVGGLVPTPLALAEYPDDVTPHSSRYAAYLALKKRCLVSVYTRGVEHSLAFKLGETLAASQCLVSVPLRYELPAPLVAGEHYLPFDDTAECIEACHRLLAMPALAREMRHANHQYYCKEVEPATHVAQVLERVTDLTPHRLRR